MKKIWNTLLKEVETSYNLKILKEVINKQNEERIKFEILWPLAIRKRIKIHQTRRTKSLYPQLVVFIEDKPFTFYPQSYGKSKIDINQFLEGLLKEEILCLHEKVELIEYLKKRS
ncbi:MAG: hypothetical protein AB1397_03170 [bacterium]